MVHSHAEGPAFFAWLPKMFGKRVVVELREAIESILKRISKIELEVYEKVTQLKSEEEISIIRESVNKEYENIDKCIKEIEDRLGR